MIRSIFFLTLVSCLSAAPAPTARQQFLVALDAERTFDPPGGEYYRTPRQQEMEKMRRDAQKLYQTAWFEGKNRQKVTSLRRLFTIAADANHPLNRAALLYLGHNGGVRQVVASEAAAVNQALAREPPIAPNNVLGQRLKQLEITLTAIPPAGSVTRHEWSGVFRELL